MSTRERADHHVGPLHVIVRGYTDNPQYGCLLWGGRDGIGRTLDVWVRQTLVTFRFSR